MPRKRKTSDDLYNARRRVRRAADRLEKQGRNAEAQRLRDLASTKSKTSIFQLDAASKTYKAQRIVATTKSNVFPTTSNVDPTTYQPQKTPRKKTKADEVYNARRRLKRQAERIEREAKGLQGVAREQAKGFAKYLRELAKPTGKLTEQQQKETLERLGSVREATRSATYEPFRVRRRNLIFMQQMNAAGMKDADSSIPERKKDVFWAATKGIWTGEDVARNKRYDRIAEYFYNLSEGASSTATSFQKWLMEKKGKDPREVFGDMQLIYEYVTEELNDPLDYESPETPYGTWINRILFAR